MVATRRSTTFRTRTNRSDRVMSFFSVKSVP